MPHCSLLRMSKVHHGRNAPVDAAKRAHRIAREVDPPRITLIFAITRRWFALMNLGSDTTALEALGEVYDKTLLLLVSCRL